MTHSQDLIRLKPVIAQITALAADFGLDPLPMHYEIVSAQTLDALAAYLLPVRYAHWSFGKAYDRLRQARGQALYLLEQVTNTNPVCVYLREGNSPLENSVVVAHALAHSDFFHHNNHIAQQLMPATMVNCMRSAKQRIVEYVHSYGQEAVELVINAGLAMQPHVNPTIHALNASTCLACSDLLWFVIVHGKYLSDWEKDVLCILRDEALYFRPQKMTKIINEGWACLWHTQLVHALNLPLNDITYFAALQAALLGADHDISNPYRLGLQLFMSILEQDAALATGGTPVCLVKGGKGRETIFQVRTEEDDASFLRHYLTEEFFATRALHHPTHCQPHASAAADQTHRQSLVATIIDQVPIIHAVDSDYKGQGALYLQHEHHGRDLHLRHASGVLRLLASIWRRPVFLETIVGGQRVVLSAS